MTFVIRRVTGRKEKFSGSAHVTVLSRRRVTLSVDRKDLPKVLALAPFFSVAKVEGADEGKISFRGKQPTGSNKGFTNCYLFPHEAQVTVHARHKLRGR